MTGTSGCSTLASSDVAVRCELCPSDSIRKACCRDDEDRCFAPEEGSISTTVATHFVRSGKSPEIMLVTSAANGRVCHESCNRIELVAHGTAAGGGGEDAWQTCLQ